MLKTEGQFSLPEVEEKVLKFWKEEKIFNRSLETKKGTKAKKKPFVFYEGPPTANGRPGIHHVLARSFKDIVLRYKTMQGYSVPRKGGWDTHGLPVELEVEKQLGLKSKKEIEEYGIAEFNHKCKESVWKYKDEWEKLTDRMGYWLDMDDPYITYENSYIETVWWIFKEISKKNYLYKGHKVVPWCTRCGTALSSHELALGYKEVEDTSVFIKFKVAKGEKIGSVHIADQSTFILSWTTTPWTLPGNIALAVGEKIVYSVVAPKSKKKEIYILAESRLSILEEEYEVLGTVKGKDLIGVSYEPLFEIPAFVSGSAKEVSYKVYGADFVTTEDGTGVVHTAVMYGEDDYNLGKKIGLPEVHTVDETGRFVESVPEFAGMYAKSKETEKKIIEALEAQHTLLRTELYKHEYPFCWRCGSPLLYYARHSWFIRMSDLRTNLQEENKKINWVPEHLRDGRFGEWIREVKDWAISRERYWGTPLPIWECEGCKKITVLGGVEDLEHTQTSRKNTYILIRHGEAESNAKNIISSWPEKTKQHLTEKGKKEIEKLSKKLQKEHVDLIFSSDITRTKETAGIIKDALHIPVIFDERLREVDFGDFNNISADAYHAHFGSLEEKFSRGAPGGENFTEVRKRVYEFIKEVDAKYEGKNIAIVSHEDPIWLLESVLSGWDMKQTLKEKENHDGVFIVSGESRKAELRTVPRDETGLFDLHRPYIDEFVFPCASCGSSMKRIPEVGDVWFDSGAMPFAEEHYPFAYKNTKKKLPFPADYISEGIDQTRGWFYTLLAISSLLGKGTSFKNVISLGLVLDKAGQKMSKSKGNVVSPWDVMEKHGADVIRWYFYTVNPPGEPKKFDEIELQKVMRQFFSLIYNSYVFFDLYGDKNCLTSKKKITISNTLDIWVSSRLEETIEKVTKSLDAYNVGDAAKSIESFVDDLSRWYIRRSRRRLQKPESKEDYIAVSKVLGSSLSTLARLIAPFAPFFAEALYRSFPGGAQSVHLAEWPENNGKVNHKLIEEMAEVRRAASVALAKRAEKGIKVRQPLASVTLSSPILKGKKEMCAILMDEINVKEVLFDVKSSEDVVLDTNVTKELKQEGLLRELQRMVQDLRQEAKFMPKDEIVLHIEAPNELFEIVDAARIQFMKEINANAIEWKRVTRFDAEISTHIDSMPLWLAVRKK